MNVMPGPAETRPPLPRMTREEFLDWVERQEESYEFDGERPVPMQGDEGVTGGNRGRTLIVTALISALYVRLRGGPFAVHHSEGPGVSAGPQAVRYPDVAVAPRRGTLEDRLLDDAVVLFEVVSPTSGARDRVVKLRDYLAVPSVLRYVVLESDARVASVFSRKPGAESWVASACAAGETLPLPEIGVEVPMAEIYEGIDIPPEDEEPRNPVATT